VPRVALSADRIVTTAEQLIRETGSTEWTVRALCKELECAPGAIYRYFPGGVDAIGAEIRSRHLVELTAILDAAEDDATAPGLASLVPATVAARLSRRCRAYLAFARAQDEVYRSLFAYRSEGRRGQAMALAQDCLIDRPAELVRRAAGERELNRPSIGRFDSERLALMIWSRLHGHADLLLSHLADERLDELEDRLLIDILAVAGFKVAAYPAGLEAAAKAARASAGS
jgi:AcrR family transcriptional regulator